MPWPAKTIGARREVAIEAQGILVAAPPGMEWNSARNRFVCFVDNVVEELPLILDRIQRVGGTIKDLEVHQPNLHHVFLHLTGKELRDRVNRRPAQDGSSGEGDSTDSDTDSNAA